MGILPEAGQFDAAPNPADRAGLGGADCAVAVFAADQLVLTVINPALLPYHVSQGLV